MAATHAWRANKIGVAEATPMILQTPELQNLNVLSLPALGTLFDIELNRLPLLEAAEAVRLDGGVMDEYVLAILAADKTETLDVVEPLNCTLFHFCVALFFVELCGEVNRSAKDR
jgi:hypothetical protein